MELTHVLAVLVGIGLLAIASADIFLTVLHYDGYGPASRRLYRWSWAAGREIAERLPERQAGRFLALVGTFLLLATILMWVVLAWLGFALLYLPAMGGGFLHTTTPSHPLLDALYFSGVSLSTVGFGDLVPTQPFLRLASVVESLAGFMILTVSISYLLGVYGVLRNQSLLAAMLDDQAGGEADPLRLATALRRHDATATKLDDLHRSILSHNEGLQLYPLVYYIRRPVSRRSAIYVLRMVGEASADLRWALPAADPVTTSPALMGLVRSHRRLMSDLRQLFITDDPSERETMSEPALKSRFSEARKALANGAEEGSEDETNFEAWSAFVRELDGVVRSTVSQLAFSEDEVGLDVRTR